MSHQLLFTSESRQQLQDLKDDPGKLPTLKAVAKALRYMEANLRHPALQTHQIHSRRGPNGAKVFESYAQNKTPGAWRIFWSYGPGKDEITVLQICPHPD